MRSCRKRTLVEKKISRDLSKVWSLVNRKVICQLLSCDKYTMVMKDVSWGLSKNKTKQNNQEITSIGKGWGEIGSC